MGLGYGSYFAQNLAVNGLERIYCKNSVRRERRHPPQGIACQRFEIGFDLVGVLTTAIEVKRCFELRSNGRRDHLLKFGGINFEAFVGEISGNS